RPRQEVPIAQAAQSGVQTRGDGRVESASDGTDEGRGGAVPDRDAVRQRNWLGGGGGCDRRRIRRKFHRGTRHSDTRWVGRGGRRSARGERIDCAGRVAAPDSADCWIVAGNLASRRFSE